MTKKALVKGSLTDPYANSRTGGSKSPRPTPDPLIPIVVLVGLGNLARKIYPYLYAFRQDKIIDLAVIDVQPRYDQIVAWSTDTFLEETGLNRLWEATTKPKLVGDDINKAHEELKSCVWVNDAPDSPSVSASLKRHIDKALHGGKRKVLFYLALHPDLYARELERYASFATRFALEKPFSPNSIDGNDLLKLLRRIRQYDNVVVVDHWVFKPTVLLMERFLQSPSIRHLIDYSDSIEFFFQEKRPAHGVASRYGLVKDFGPHVMAVLNELTKSLGEIEFVSGWDTGTEHPVITTYLELRLFKGTNREKHVHVHLGKGHTHVRKCLIFHYRGDTLTLDLVNQKVFLSYSSGNTPLELSAVPDHETEDPAYRFILKSLINGLNDSAEVSGLFLDARKANKILEQLDKMNCALVEPGQGRYPKPLVKGLAPTIVFDLFGVILDGEKTLRAIVPKFFRSIGCEDCKIDMRRQLLGRTGPEIIRTLLKQCGLATSPAAVAKALRLYTGLVREMNKADLKGLLTKGAEAYLELLKSRGCTVVLLTSTPRNDLQVIVDTLDLKDAIHSLVPLEEYPGETKPTVVASTLERIRRTREDCIVIDDSLSILRAIRRYNHAGTRTVGIGFGAAACLHKGELWKKHHMRAVPNVAALSEYLRRQPGTRMLLADE
jgi:phosphoglycolate phosphatase-like HAD superfamily hydrolase